MRNTGELRQFVFVYIIRCQGELSKERVGLSFSGILNACFFWPVGLFKQMKKNLRGSGVSE
jgi:hypothetical protein